MVNSMMSMMSVEELDETFHLVVQADPDALLVATAIDLAGRWGHVDGNLILSSLQLNGGNGPRGRLVTHETTSIGLTKIDATSHSNEQSNFNHSRNHFNVPFQRCWIGNGSKVSIQD